MWGQTSGFNREGGGSSFGVSGILLAIPNLQIEWTLRLLGRLGYGEVQGISFNVLAHIWRITRCAKNGPDMILTSSNVIIATTLYYAILVITIKFLFIVIPQV